MEGEPSCCHIRGTRTARAKRTKAADGFPAPMNYFEVTETQGPLRVVRGEIQEWGVNHENTFTLSYSIGYCSYIQEENILTLVH